MVLSQSLRQRAHHWNCVALSGVDGPAVRKVGSGAGAGAATVKIVGERREVCVMVA